MEGLSRRAVLLGATGATLLGAGFGFGACLATVSAAKQRVSLASQLMNTPYGTLEYGIGGHGDPFLMIHGTGGGFDQGLRFGQGLMARGFEVIAPSRFGYLRSTFPDDPSPACQADVFAVLLDHLAIDRLPVAGGSAGALPAVQFALRHPDRCSALILLVPAMNLENRDPVEFTALQRFLVNRLLSSDAWFWFFSRLMPGQMIGTLLATDANPLEAVSAVERERAHLILNELMPVSERTLGMLNDGHYSGNPSDTDLSSITPPTLLISAEDDRFDTAATARIMASRIPSAELIIYPTGGHIWLGHDDDVASEIASFVRTRQS